MVLFGNRTSLLLIYVLYCHFDVLRINKQSFLLAYNEEVSNQNIDNKMANSRIMVID